ncbi:hypothetical protein ACTA71_012551 [Dictyostelium dimigraforme]
MKFVDNSWVSIKLERHKIQQFDLVVQKLLIDTSHDCNVTKKAHLNRIVPEYQKSTQAIIQKNNYQLFKKEFLIQRKDKEEEQERQRLEEECMEQETLRVIGNNQQQQQQQQMTRANIFATDAVTATARGKNNTNTTQIYGTLAVHDDEIHLINQNNSGIRVTILEE